MAEEIKVNPEEQEKTGVIRDEKGRFVPGVSANPEGRPEETEEQKAIRKATKELIANYKQKLAEALPEISPVLIAKAISGDIQAIKEVHDRIMGKSRERIGHGGEEEGEPIIFQWK